MKSKFIFSSLLIVVYALLSNINISAQSGLNNFDQRNTAEKARKIIFDSKIKSESTFSDAGKISFRRFDDYGNLLENIKYDNSGDVVSRLIQKFENNEILIESSQYTSKTKKTLKTIFSYEKGNLTAAKSYNSAGEELFRLEYKYNEKNQMIQMISATPNKLMRSRVRLNYDLSGNIVEMSMFNLDTDAPLSTTVHNYDQFGRKEKTIRKSPEGEVLALIDYKYDEQGNPEEMISRNSSNEIFTLAQYTYDSNGNLIESVSSAPSADMKMTVKSEYNERGIITSQTTLNKFDQPVKHVKYVYEYYE